MIKHETRDTRHEIVGIDSQQVLDSLELENCQFSIVLPLSKSVRARELVLDALDGQCVEVDEENDDLFVLSRALHNAQLEETRDTRYEIRDTRNQQSTVDNRQLLEVTFNSQFSIFNLEASGTALRFLTAYCAVSEGSFLLTGSKRLCERPIKPLVDVLRQMGARIEYVEKEGFAPLKIEGGQLNGGRVRLDASLSSQFASALMLIADKVEGGIDIEYEGDVASQSYIRLTQKVIERYKSGVRYSEERDWSSAMVWYAAMAVLRKGKFLLEGLGLDSWQPDRAIVEVFEKLGVRTKAVENGVEVVANSEIVEELVLDCKNMPDAVMYIVVAACLLGVKFEISGVETLRVKESDRIEALISEMRKCGYTIQCTMHNARCTIHNAQYTILSPSAQRPLVHNVLLEEQVPKIKTYNDHRVAMAMAVVGLEMDVEIENPEVVNKSYPDFWREFNRMRNVELGMRNYDSIYKIINRRGK